MKKHKLTFKLDRGKDPEKQVNIRVCTNVFQYGKRKFISASTGVKCTVADWNKKQSEIRESDDFHENIEIRKDNLILETISHNWKAEMTLGSHGLIKLVFLNPFYFLIF